VLSAEPAVLLLFDETAPWAQGHVDQIRQFVQDTYGFAADLTPCPEKGTGKGDRFIF